MEQDDDRVERQLLGLDIATELRRRWQIQTGRPDLHELTLDELRNILDGIRTVNEELSRRTEPQRQDADLESELSQALNELAHVLLIDEQLDGNLQRILRLVCRLSSSCDGASISMLVDGEPTTAATTDRVVLELDLVQYENTEGPCLAALGGHMVRIGFVPTDERFPHFATGAADSRVLSVLSTPAIDHGFVVGSLNLYSYQADAFTGPEQQIALVFAAEVANAIVKSTTMRRARRTRDRVQQQHDERALVSRAQGVLMAIEECNAIQAHSLIANASRENNESLLDTACRILAAAQAAEPAIPPNER